MRTYTAGVDLDAVREALRTERERRGWTLDDVAERAQLHRSAVHEVEVNRSGKPQFMTIARMIEAFGLTVGDFFGQLQRGLHKEFIGATTTPTPAEQVPPTHGDPVPSASAFSPRGPGRRPLDDIGALIATNTAALDELIEAVRGVAGELRAAREQDASTRDPQTEGHARPRKARRRAVG